MSFSAGGNHLNIEDVKWEVFASGRTAAACSEHGSFSLETLIKHSRRNSDETELDGFRTGYLEHTQQ